MTSTSRAFATSFAVVLLLGCAKEPALNVEQGDASSGAAPMQSAHASASAQGELPAGHPAVSNPTPDAMTAGQPGALPAGHPAVATPASAGELLPPVDASAGTGAAALAWTAPAGWVSEPPANSMRRAQYRIPAPGGDGECVVFYFGPGQGGAPMENAERWASQFSDAAGQPATATMKTRTEQVNGVQLLFVEAGGTYHAGSMMGMGQVVAKPDWALLGAVAEGADANWFFKFTGPKATVEAGRAAFEAMLRSVKRGG